MTTTLSGTPAATTTRRAWTMLALGVSAQAGGTFLVSAPAYLIAQLHLEQGMSLARAGLLASAPTAGMVLALVAWGALADRRGERLVMSVGMALTALAGLGAALAASGGPLVALLVLGGAAAASTNAASGRVVVGWFPRERRGLAMGIRQMSQPLGVALAALLVPPLAEHWGIGAPFLVAAALAAALAAGCAAGIRNPPHPARAAGAPTVRTNPYRTDSFLVRIHMLSMLLVLPQFTLSIFALVWLTTQMGWTSLAAGAAIAAAQGIGAAGRIAIGMLSDRVGSRVLVLRWVAISGIVVLLALALTAALHASIAAAILLIVATAVSVADNGLAFTSVAEAAGSRWSGRALGIQNTGQFVAATAVGPGMGALIAVTGYPLALALVALAPAAALVLIPRADQEADAH